VNSQVHDNTVWLPLSAVAKEFGKSRQTIHLWCQDGFILTLGYRARRTPKGYWLLAKVSNPAQTPLSK